MTRQLQDILDWLQHGKYRLQVLERIARFEQQGVLPDQVRALTGIGLEEGTSAYGNGRLAIHGLLGRNFLINEEQQPRRYALRVNWEQIGVCCDWLEDHGMKRLKVESLKAQ